MSTYSLSRKIKAGGFKVVMSGEGAHETYGSCLFFRKAYSCDLTRHYVLQVRASVPMYILARKIKAGGFKVVMSGEGADEIYGGYLFFHKAPSPKEFQQ